MTVTERRNAATFILHTTVRPFTFMGTSFRCFYCLKYFSEVPLLLEHTSTHEVHDLDEILNRYIPKGKRTLQADISNLKCKICHENFEDLNKVKTHLTSRHDVVFNHGSNGMTEYNMAAKNGAFSCHVCSSTFHNFSLLNNHMNGHVGKVVCENCGAAFLNQYLLMKHKETHLLNRFRCKSCDRVFFKKSQLKYHTEIVHKGKERVKLKKCPNCPETFKEHYKKMMHMKNVHGIAKNFQCHLCHSNFNTRRALTEHITRYHTEKFKCQVCSKCFSIESKLIQHLRGHSGEKNYVCPVCKNAYMHKMTLSKHMRSHTSAFKCICSECGSGFHTKVEFSKHMKQWHQGFEEIK